MVREQPVRADVEDRVLRCAVDPRPDETFGERLARRVDLHDARVLGAVDDLGGRDDGTDLDLRVHALARAATALPTTSRLVGAGRATTAAAPTTVAAAPTVSPAVGAGTF
jgi:hypothetical protein